MGGSIIDPDQVRREQLQDELRAITDGLNVRTQRLADKQIALNPDLVQLLRMEHLIDFLVPRHSDKSDRGDAMPTSIERLEFELGWQRKLLDVVKGVEDEVKSNASLLVPKGPSLIVPGKG